MKKFIKISLVERQKILGFSTSEASANLFAILLHKLNLITPDHNVNHRFFASIQRAKDRYQQEFDHKDKILEKLVQQEEYRTKLCYGRSKNTTVVEDAIKNLYELKKLVEEAIGEEI